MTEIFSYMTDIINEKNLDDESYATLVEKFILDLSKLNRQTISQIYKQKSTGTLDLTQILIIFRFATSVYNVNATRTDLAIGLANLTLLLRQFIEAQDIILDKKDGGTLAIDDNRVIAPLLLDYPQLTPRELHPSVRRFQQATLKNFLYGKDDGSRLGEARRELLNLQIKELGVGQILETKDLNNWLKILAQADSLD